MIEPSDVRAEAEQCAAEFGVRPDIHREDFIFQFVVSHPHFSSRLDAMRCYFSDGNRSAKRLETLVSKHLPTKDAPKILEFAAGYGCVSRHLSISKHRGQIISCDIHDKAIEFLRNNLNMASVLSEHKPEDMSAEHHYDVVFALSFFSHMPDQTWGRWLRSLFSLVSEGGILIFTTHGRITRQELFQGAALDDRGYYFRPESEQADLPAEEYGTTIVLPRYVFAHIGLLPDAHLLAFEEAAWWEHQDTYVVRRSADSQPAPAAAA